MKGKEIRTNTGARLIMTNPDRLSPGPGKTVMQIPTAKEQNRPTGTFRLNRVAETNQQADVRSPRASQRLRQTDQQTGLNRLKEVQLRAKNQARCPKVTEADQTAKQKGHHKV